MKSYSNLVKKSVLSTLVTCLSFQSFAMTKHMTSEEIIARNQALREQFKNVDTKKATIEDLDKGLQEIRTNLSILRQDLEIAEVRADGRTAVKVQNGIVLTTGGLITLALIAEKFSKDPQGGGGIISGFIFLALGGALTAGTAGYIYLTNHELRSLEKTISNLEDKMERLDRKILERKAGL